MSYLGQSSRTQVLNVEKITGLIDDRVDLIQVDKINGMDVCNNFISLDKISFKSTNERYWIGLSGDNLFFWDSINDVSLIMFDKNTGQVNFNGGVVVDIPNLETGSIVVDDASFVKLYVSNDASINGNLFVGGEILNTDLSNRLYSIDISLQNVILDVDLSAANIDVSVNLKVAGTITNAIYDTSFQTLQTDLTNVDLSLARIDTSLNGVSQNDIVKTTLTATGDLSGVNATLRNVEITGTTMNLPEVFILDPAPAGISGEVQIHGDLRVLGTEFVVDSEVISISGAWLRLNSDGQVLDSGIKVGVSGGTERAWYINPVDGKWNSDVSVNLAHTLSVQENIGIGVDNPDERLVVSGSGNTNIQNTTSGSNAYYKSKSSTGEWGSGTSGTSYGVYDYNEAAFRMAIDNQGKVGIGTTAPQEKLHISGAGTQRVEVENTNTGFAFFKMTEGSGSSKGMGVNNANDFYIYDYTQAASRMNLDTNGQLGLGDNNQSITGGQINIEPDSNTTDFTAVKVIANNNDSNLIRADAGITGYGGSLRYMGSRTGNNNSMSVFMDNQVGTEVEAITVLQDGRTGIGITEPQTNLDVLGDVSFGGSIINTALSNTIAATGDHLVRLDNSVNEIVADINVIEISSNIQDNSINTLQAEINDLSSATIRDDASFANVDISVNLNVDGKTILKNMKLDNFGFANWGGIGHKDCVDNSYALLQNNEGKTLLNAAAGQTLHRRINNLDYEILSETQLTLGRAAVANYNVKLNGDVSCVSDVDVAGTLKIDGVDVKDLFDASFIFIDASLVSHQASIAAYQVILDAYEVLINANTNGLAATDLSVVAIRENVAVSDNSINILFLADSSNSIYALELSYNSLDNSAIDFEDRITTNTNGISSNNLSILINNTILTNAITATDASLVDLSANVANLNSSQVVQDSSISLLVAEQLRQDISINQLESGTDASLVDLTGRLDVLDTSVNLLEQQQIVQDSSINAANITKTNITVLNDISVNGILHGAETMILDPRATGDNTGLVVIKGNLQVDGSSTIINAEELDISDVIIKVASNLTGTPPASLEAGLEVNRGDENNSKLVWVESTDKWELREGSVLSTLNVGTLEVGGTNVKFQNDASWINLNTSISNLTDTSAAHWAQMVLMTDAIDTNTTTNNTQNAHLGRLDISVNILDISVNLVEDGLTATDLSITNLRADITASDTSWAQLNINDLTDGQNENNTVILGNIPSGITSTAVKNTLIGVDAGSAITTEDENTLIGFQAGLNNTAANCVMIGSDAGKFFSSGVQNTFIGRQSGLGSSGNSTGNNNTGVGHKSTKNLTTGTSCTGVGSFALQHLQTGNNMTGIARNAGKDVTQGTGSVFIGYEATGNSNSQNQITIGTQAVNTVNNSVLIGKEGTHTLTRIVGDISNDALTAHQLLQDNSINSIATGASIADISIGLHDLSLAFNSAEIAVADVSIGYLFDTSASHYTLINNNTTGLVATDASIVAIRAENVATDASIVEIKSQQTVQDVSIGYLFDTSASHYTLINNNTTGLVATDASIVEIKSQQTVQDVSIGLALGGSVNLQNWADASLGIVDISALDVSRVQINDYVLPAAKGSNGQYLQTDSAGNVSWVDAGTGGLTGADGKEIFRGMLTSTINLDGSTTDPVDVSGLTSRVIRETSHSNDDEFFDTTTGIMTCYVSGKYCITGQVHFNSPTSALGISRIDIRKQTGGSGSFDIVANHLSNADNGGVVSTTYTLDLSVGDKIKITAFQNSSNPSKILGLSESTDNHKYGTYFTGFLIGSGGNTFITDSDGSFVNVNISGELTFGNKGSQNTLPTSQGVSGQILKANGSGDIIWADDLSGDSIDEINSRLSVIDVSIGELIDVSNALTQYAIAADLSWSNYNTLYDTSASHYNLINTNKNKLTATDASLVDLSNNVANLTANLVITDASVNAISIPSYDSSWVNINTSISNLEDVSANLTQYLIAADASWSNYNNINSVQDVSIGLALGGSVDLQNWSDVSFGNADLCGNIDVSGLMNISSRGQFNDRELLALKVVGHVEIDSKEFEVDGGVGDLYIHNATTGQSLLTVGAPAGVGYLQLNSTGSTIATSNILPSGTGGVKIGTYSDNIKGVDDEISLVFEMESVEPPKIWINNPDNTGGIPDYEHPVRLLANVDVSGKLTFGNEDSSNNLPLNQGSNGDVLTTDGAGNLSWAAGGGGGSSKIYFYGEKTSDSSAFGDQASGQLTGCDTNLSRSAVSVFDGDTFTAPSACIMRFDFGYTVEATGGQAQFNYLTEFFEKNSTKFGVEPASILNSNLSSPFGDPKYVNSTRTLTMKFATNDTMKFYVNADGAGGAGWKYLAHGTSFTEDNNFPNITSDALCYMSGHQID